MADWKRSSRASGFEALPAEFKGLIADHIARYNLGPILDKAAHCVVTTSEQVKRGIFKPADKVVRTGAVLTPVWLVWAMQGDKSGPAVMSARLADITAVDWAGTKPAAMVPDSGVEVSGSFTDFSERGSAFIGLGDDPDGRAFKEALLKAVRDAKL